MDWGEPGPGGGGNDRGGIFVGSSGIGQGQRAAGRVVRCIFSCCGCTEGGESNGLSGGGVVTARFRALLPIAITSPVHATTGQSSARNLGSRADLGDGTRRK